MIWLFMSLGYLRFFQHYLSYTDNEEVMMYGSVQWNKYNNGLNSASSRI